MTSRFLHLVKQSTLTKREAKWIQREGYECGLFLWFEDILSIRLLSLGVKSVAADQIAILEPLFCAVSLPPVLVEVQVSKLSTESRMGSIDGTPPSRLRELARRERLACQMSSSCSAYLHMYTFWKRRRIVHSTIYTRCLCASHKNSLYISFSPCRSFPLINYNHCSLHPSRCV